MNLRQLQAFKAVMNEGTLTQAADIMAVTQPARVQDSGTSSVIHVDIQSTFDKQALQPEMLSDQQQRLRE